MTVRIMGGLGNQLFTYAAARRLASANEAELRIDHLSGFRIDTYGRRYGLGEFRIVGKLVEPHETFVRAGRYRRELVRRWSRLLPFNRRAYLSEERGDFDSRLVGLTLSRSVYLDGYWQSELYFKDFEATIREDLQFGRRHSVEAEELRRQIEEVEAVAVHVRRERYAHRLDAAYYIRAVTCLRHRLTRPHLFVFSDSPQWARQNLDFDVPTTFVTHSAGDEDGYDDMWLMSLCRHFIIANSSFSWWGAWLGEKSGTIVICPQFFANWGHVGLIPDRWEML